MSKTIKVIDLLNKIANGEIKNSTKFKIIPEDGHAFICKYGSGYPGYIWVIDNGNEISFNYKIDHMRILGYEVEIIEEQQEIDIQNIEDIKDVFIENSSCGEDVKYLARKYNEILKWAKQVDKKIKEK